MVKEYEVFVESVREVAKGTKTIRFKMPEPMDFKPGQFVMVRFNEDDTTRAYSISSLPNKDYIEITVSAVGFFSNKLCSLKGGENLIVKGPYGNMTLEDGYDGSYVFAAGGSGIAPFLGMLKYIKEKGLKNKVYVFYTARVEDMIICREELESFKDKFFVHIGITRPHLQENVWNGPVGRISVDLLEEKVPELKDSIVYLCGPPAFVTGLKEGLEKIGVKKIRHEQW